MKKVLTNGGFFRLLARKGLEKVKVSKELDPEFQDVINHVKNATEEKLRDDDDDGPPSSGTGTIETEGIEL